MSAATAMKSELIRKGIHILIAFVPVLAAVSRSNTALLLMAGMLLYAGLEGLRFAGFTPPLFSAIIKHGERQREQGSFVLGPVTLGLGALLSLILFQPAAAAVAVYTQAFGDTAATLTGKSIGRIRPRFMRGKSIEGSCACCAVTVLICFLIFRDWKTALATGVVAMLVELFSVQDFDNLLLPLAVGCTASLLSSL